METGRWGRLARENSVIQGDRSNVQDEKHVLLECPMSAPLRQRYSAFTQFKLDVSRYIGFNEFEFGKFIKKN